MNARHLLLLMKTFFAYRAGFAILNTAMVLAFAMPVHAQPVALSDDELAGITAGQTSDHFTGAPHSARDTVVTGNAAVAIVDSPSTIALEADAQTQVRAVTLINSTDSGVANGSNVWSGRHSPIDWGAETAPAQSNLIVQEDQVSGYLADWQLPGGNHGRHHTETVHSEFSGGIVSEPITFLGTDDPESLQVSLGVALAGDVDLHSDGFGASFAADYATTLTVTTETTVRWRFLWWSGSRTRTSSTSVTEDGGVSGSVSVAPFDLQASGVICHTLYGSCRPSNTGSHSSATKTEETRLIPARLQNASAGRIVMSDGNLLETIDSNVSLEGNAQSGATVAHAVNATGSLAANGLNLAHGVSMTTLPRAMNFRQHNSITQRQ